MADASFISAAAMLQHWQGHRRLTRRLIAAFPEDQLFTLTIGGMRPFGALVREIHSMGVPMLRGLVTGTWETSMDRSPLPKTELLRAWDDATPEIDALWAQIPAGLFDQTVTAFGQYPGKVHDLLLYVIDNEVHHRGQGMVYLRSLGIAPPPFYER